MTIDGWLGQHWDGGGRPLMEPPIFSPIVADPSFLFPEETPDGLWALFAHSAWGVHRYSSQDGTSWTDRGLVVRNAMRPFVRRLPSGEGKDPCYILLFEKYPPLALPLTALPGKRPWRSVLAMQESQDLRTWSRPRILLEPSLPWMRNGTLGQAVSNPYLVPESAAAASAKGPQWRLYFSAGLSYIDDCGFNEPKYIGVATGLGPDGPFRPLSDPLLGPGIQSGGETWHGSVPEEVPGSVPDAEATVHAEAGSELGAGSMKVIRLDDGWLGLQNRIFRDGGHIDGHAGGHGRSQAGDRNSSLADENKEGRSRSAIFVMRSADGLSWRQASDRPLVAPDSGWKSSHVYACDCRFREADGRWYLYFNARDGWRISEGRERIGRLVSG